MAVKTKKKASPKKKPKGNGQPRAKTKAKPKKKARKHRAPKPAELRHGELITIKVTSKEKAMIYARADRFAGGNVSRLLRHAARVCKTRAPESARKAS
jgi:hypothetical protein